MYDSLTTPIEPRDPQDVHPRSHDVTTASRRPRHVPTSATLVQLLVIEPNASSTSPTSLNQTTTTNRLCTRSSSSRRRPRDVQTLQHVQHALTIVQHFVHDAAAAQTATSCCCNHPSRPLDFNGFKTRPVSSDSISSSWLQTELLLGSISIEFLAFPFA